MLKRNLLVLSLLAGVALGAPALPAESRFESAVSVQTGSSSNNLVVLLQALGNSVGLTVVTDGVPADKTVNYNISNKPFREVWDVLIKINDLDFEILGNDIVVVGPKTVVDKFRPAPAAEPPKVVASDPVVREFYSVKSDTDAVIKFLQETAKDISVTRFGNSRLIAISGTAAQQAEVAKLLQVVDVPTSSTAVVPSAEPTERRFYGTNLPAEEVAAFLKAEVPGAVINRVGATRTLSITATAEQQAEIATLLTTIDPPPPAPQVVAAPAPTERRFYTANMAPEDLVAFLKAEVPTAVVNRVGTTRTLSITAPAEQQAEIATLLATVDPAPKPVQVDSTPTAPTAEPPVRRFYTTNIAPDEIIAFLKLEVPSAVINRVGTTRTLSITAPAKQQDEITALLSSVDIAPEQPAPIVRVQQIFRLSHAKADELKAVLTQTFAGNNAAANNAAENNNPNLIIVNPNGNAANNANNAQSTDVSAQAPDIIADVRTNSLIVRGTQNQLNQISDAILSLDKRVPQVNVQVRIQEISRTAANSLGLDWTAPFGNFSTLSFGGNQGIKSVFNAASNLVGFNLGATLDALEKQNLLKRVDDASLTLQSGQAEPAAVKSGGTLIVSLVGSGVTIERTLDYGVTVNVSNLQVSNDGTITMKVNASVKNFTTAPTDPQLINLTNNEASTLLSFKSGSTVLLGGLLSVNKKDNTAGVPILSSIPLIGGLFKKTEIEDKETQLMLVITANTIE